MKGKPNKDISEHLDSIEFKKLLSFIAPPIHDSNY